MGQKVHPTGFRLKTQVLYKKNQIKENFTFNNWKNLYCAGNNKNTYSQSFYQNLIIKKFITNYFVKLDFWVNNITVSQTDFKIKINVQIFNIKQQSIIKDISSELIFIENFLIEILSKTLFSQTSDNKPSTSISIKLDFLNKRVNDPLIKQLSNGLKGAQYKPYALTTISILSLAINIPVAPLIATALAEAIKTTNRHQTVVDFFEEILKLLFQDMKQENIEQNLKLRGCLIQVKGRINGSERSRRSIIRLGSLPLHTITVPIDYAFEEVCTPYGMCGIKVWFCYKNN